MTNIDQCQLIDNKVDIAIHNAEQEIEVLSQTGGVYNKLYEYSEPTNETGYRGRENRKAKIYFDTVLRPCLNVVGFFLGGR